MFEWYDFYIYGTLGAFLAKYFFSNVPPNVGFIFALLAFAAGFAVRPFGALIFGRLGDMIGRKYTFLITMTLMGVGTFFIGVLPGYASWGIAAPVVLIALRLVQGLALGGEYGGAAIYVAEHAPAEQARLLHVLDSDHRDARPVPGAAADPRRPHLRWAKPRSAIWGWRIPFLLSVILLAVSIWIRLKLNESPMFQKMKEEGKQSKRPLGEAFGEWSNAKIAHPGSVRRHRRRSGGVVRRAVLCAVLPDPDPEGAGVTAQIMIVVALALGTPCFILFGWLSDKIGRKPIMLAGFLLAALTYFPIFKGITHFANPKLETALADRAGDGHRRSRANARSSSRRPAPRSSPPAATSSKSGLVNLSVNYHNEAAPAGTNGQVKIGDTDARRRRAGFRQAAIAAAIKTHGYPASADPAEINYADDGAPAVAARGLRDAGLRADRRLAGGTVPDPHPLQRPVAALSHRQRLVRRLPAGDRVRHRRRDRQHLFRAVVPDRDRRDEPRRRAAVPARNQGSRHHRYVT